MGLLKNFSGDTGTHEESPHLKHSLDPSCTKLCRIFSSLPLSYASNADNYILIQKVAEDTIVLLLSPIKMQSVLLHIRQICLVFHSTLLFHPWLPADISTTPGKN
jgi:hypothetical protein